jgi:hypothetical protein
LTCGSGVSNEVWRLKAEDNEKDFIWQKVPLLQGYLKKKNQPQSLDETFPGDPALQVQLVRVHVLFDTQRDFSSVTLNGDAFFD